MTDKQGETLYRLKMSINTPLNGGSTIIIDKEDIETVLTMLKEKDKEIEKKDKIIDLMAERIEWLCKSNGILLDKEHDENFTQEDIKKYFERKVRDERN